MPVSKKSKTAEATTKAPNKTTLVTQISEATGLTKAQVGDVFTALEDVLASSIVDFKQFTLPGLIKVSVAHKPATPEHQGRNPRTGETMTVKAKPPRNVIRLRALKRLKDIVV